MRRFIRSLTGIEVAYIVLGALMLISLIYAIDYALYVTFDQ